MSSVPMKISAKERAKDERRKDVCRANDAVRDPVERYERILDPALDHDERSKQSERSAEGAQRAAVTPAPVLALVDGENEEQQATRDGDRTAEIEAGFCIASTLREEHDCGEGQGDAERNVDEEDPLPADTVG